MAVQILNDLPDAEVNRGDPVEKFLRELNEPRAPSLWRAYLSGRAGFMVITIALHVIAALALMSVRHVAQLAEPEPIEMTIVESAQQQETTPPDYVPPTNIVYAVTPPQDLQFETESSAPQEITTAIAPSTAEVVAPQMVEWVEYLRPPAPVYPSESNRRREHGIVVLRVIVDTTGHAAQIQIERSSGYGRLDAAARQAVEKALFRPYEVNGVAQPAQVLIPIEFTRRAT